MYLYYHYMSYIIQNVLYLLYVCVFVSSSSCCCYWLVGPCPYSIYRRLISHKFLLFYHKNLFLYRFVFNAIELKELHYTQIHWMHYLDYSSIYGIYVSFSNLTYSLLMYYVQFKIDAFWLVCSCAQYSMEKHIILYTFIVIQIKYSNSFRFEMAKFHFIKKSVHYSQCEKRFPSTIQTFTSKCNFSLSPWCIDVYTIHGVVFMCELHIHTIQLFIQRNSEIWYSIWKS